MLIWLVPWCWGCMTICSTTQECVPANNLHQIHFVMYKVPGWTNCSYLHVYRWVHAAHPGCILCRNTGCILGTTIFVADIGYMQMVTGNWTICRIRSTCIWCKFGLSVVNWHKVCAAAQVACYIGLLTSCRGYVVGMVM